MREIPFLTDDPKRRRILEAAAGHFLAYGFARTTMDDIARAADMSRPAVYLHFKNKTEIYQELAAGYATRLVKEAEATLAGPEPLGERVFRMFDVCFICLHEELQESPHGAELMDMKEAMSANFEVYRQRISTTLAAAIAASSPKASKGAPEALADILLDAFDGAKVRGVSTPELRALARRLGGLAKAGVE